MMRSNDRNGQTGSRSNPTPDRRRGPCADSRKERTMIRTWTLILITSLIQVASSTYADVAPPLEVSLEPLNDLPRSDNTLPIRISVTVPRLARNREARIALTWSAEGVVQTIGDAEWQTDAFVPG